MKKKSVLLLLVGLFAGICATWFSKNGNTAECEAFKDTQIIFFVGGDENGPFAQLIQKGAEDAQRYLGVNVEYVYSDWDIERMVAQFIDAIERRPDGIVMMGHPGDKRLDPLIKEAYRKNITITTLNTPLPYSQELFRSTGFGYVGQQQYESGYNFGKTILEYEEFDTANPVLLFGVEEMGERSRRTHGIRDAFKKAGFEIHFEEVTSEYRHLSDDIIRTRLMETLAEIPNLELLVVDDAILERFPAIMTRMGIEAEDLFVAGYDFYESNIDDLRSGRIDMVADQQPYMQGFMSLIQICYATRFHFRGLNVDTGQHYITKDNIETMIHHVDLGIR